MSRTLHNFCAEEYRLFRDLLVETWGLDEGGLRRVEPELKPLHKRCLSLSCAATVVSHRAPRNEHSRGIAEAAHLALVLAIKGLENPSCVLLRQIIELLLKHVYFSSHPTEYRWAQTRVDYKDLNFQFLLEYLRRTEEIRGCARGKDLSDRIAYWYSVFSRHVHVLNATHIPYCTPAATRGISLASLRKLDERTGEFWPIATMLLVIFAPSKFRRASLIEQRLIKGVMPREYARIISGFD